MQYERAVRQSRRFGWFHVWRLAVLFSFGLVHGTLIVTVLYLLLNYVFLRTVPLSELAGRLEVGALSAVSIFGGAGGVLASAMICVLLVSSISAMVLAGPRVLQVAGEDLLRHGERAGLTPRRGRDRGPALGEGGHEGEEPLVLPPIGHRGGLLA